MVSAPAISTTRQSKRSRERVQQAMINVVPPRSARSTMRGRNETPRVNAFQDWSDGQSQRSGASTPEKPSTKAARITSVATESAQSAQDPCMGPACGAWGPVVNPFNGGTSGKREVMVLCRASSEASTTDSLELTSMVAEATAMAREREALEKKLSELHPLQIPRWNGTAHRSKADTADTSTASSAAEKVLDSRENCGKDAGNATDSKSARVLQDIAGSIRLPTGVITELALKAFREERTAPKSLEQARSLHQSPQHLRGLRQARSLHKCRVSAERRSAQFNEEIHCKLECLQANLRV